MGHGASSDAFLSVQAKRAGRVKGESVAQGHEDEIDLIAWRWSVSASSAVGSSAATARRSYSGLTVVKLIDAASTSLLSVLATNDEIKEAVLTVRKAGDGALDYYLIRLREARVTQVEQAIDAQGGTQEHVTFSFRKVDVEYRRQDAAGLRGATNTFSDEILPAA